MHASSSLASAGGGGGGPNGAGGDERARAELHARVCQVLQGAGGGGASLEHLVEGCRQLALPAGVRDVLDEMEADVTIYQKDGRYFLL